MVVVKDLKVSRPKGNVNGHMYYYNTYSCVFYITRSDKSKCVAIWL